MRRISTISLSPRRPQSLRFPPSSRSAAPPTSAPALKFFARIPGRSHALPSSCRLCILCASIPLPSLSRPRPVPSPRPPSRTRIFSRVHLSPASLQKQETARCLPIFFGRPRLFCSRPRRLPFRSPSRRMLPGGRRGAAGNPRTPARLCSCRFLRLRSRTSLPLTAEESPHAPPRQLQPHAPPRADCQNVHSSGKPHSPPYSLRPCAPSLRPRPPSRTFSPQPRPFAPSPAIFSLRPSNRPPFPRVPAQPLPPRAPQTCPVSACGRLPAPPSELAFPAFLRDPQPLRPLCLP